VELRFSKAKAALKGALAAAALGLCLALAILAFARDREGVALPMAIAIPIAAWGVIRSIGRFRAEGPALKCADHGVVVNRVFNRSFAIPYDQIERVDFARADKVALVGGPLGSRGKPESDCNVVDNAPFGERLATKAGAAFRWGFQIVYREANGERRGLRLFDNDVEGGREALLKFAEDIRSNLHSRGLHV
jgi:hypothetical protein